MQSLTVFTLLILLFLTGCSSTPKMSATEYNDFIVKEQQLIVNEMRQFNNDDGSNLEHIEQKRLKIVTQCDSSLFKIEQLEDFDGKTSLKNAALELFTFYKTVCDNEYQEMIAIMNKSLITKEDIEKLKLSQEKNKQQEIKLDKQLETAQNEFAKDQGIKIRLNSSSKVIN